MSLPLRAGGALAPWLGVQLQEIAFRGHTVHAQLFFFSRKGEHRVDRSAAANSSASAGSRWGRDHGPGLD